LYTDASCVAAGAVLLQDGQPVEFFSRKFSPTEQRYSTHEREALAVVTSILHFRFLLLGTQFVVFTDHKSLEFWLERAPVNERHARWLTRLQDMVFTVKYIPGQRNIFADLMSRPPGVERSTFDDFHENVNVNAICIDGLIDRIKVLQTEAFIKSCKVKPDNLVRLDGLAYYAEGESTPRLLLPEELRAEVIETVHGLGHYGRRM
jgi:hypothetical protein